MFKFPISSDMDALDTIVQLSIRMRGIGSILVEIARSKNEILQDLEVLTLLHNSGPQHRMQLGELGHELGITSGALTSRINNLERVDHLRREQDVRDRRQIFVTLTPLGLERVAEARRLVTAADVDHVRNALLTAD